MYFQNPTIYDDNWHLLKEDVLDEEDIKIISHVVNNQKSTDALVNLEPDIGQKIRQSKITWIDYSDITTKLYNKVLDLMKWANEVKYHYQLEELDTLQHTEYHVDGYYNYHTDHPPRVMGSTRKLSCTILLNDDFKGGDFNIPVPGTGDVSLRKNQAIIFPSFMPHRINKIETGKRFSLVAWARGPNFV